VDLGKIFERGDAVEWTRRLQVLTEHRSDVRGAVESDEYGDTRGVKLLDGKVRIVVWSARPGCGKWLIAGASQSHGTPEGHRVGSAV
jgi:hypothetical protein